MELQSKDYGPYDSSDDEDEDFADFWSYIELQLALAKDHRNKQTEGSADEMDRSRQ